MDYFHERVQFVAVGSETSTRLPVLNGIQQGSTLGPLIFLLYINHIFSLPLHGKMILYADDCSLVYGTSDQEELSEQINHDISILFSFLSSINLQINLKKSKFMVFKPKSDLTLNFIKVNNQKIEGVDRYRYLGLLIDSQLKWTDHASHISKVLAKYCALIYRIRNYLSIKTLIMIYFAQIHSHLIYMLPVWGGATDSIINEIEKVQTRILKLIYNFYKFTVDDSILRFSLLVDYEAAYFI